MKANKIMELLTEKLPEIAYEQQNTTIPAIPLRYFLPYNINKFYTYQGSLTAPPCLETATWYILKQKMPISEIQVSTVLLVYVKPIQYHY